MELEVLEEKVTQEISLTASAADRVRKLLDERSLEGHALRVFVSGGGCSGLQYGMGLDPQPRETDQRFSFDDVDVIIDPVSMDHLRGSVIDYSEDLMEGGFKIENPNAVSACGCGHSFRTAGSEASSESGGCC
jgi:iron-sulfur cluster assembly accessory protein